MERVERKIGELFCVDEDGDTLTLEVVEGDCGPDCFFEAEKRCFRECYRDDKPGECDREFRSDKKNIFFKLKRF